MKKEDCIAKYGEEAWQKKLEQGRAYYKDHKEEMKARHRKWKEDHPEEVIASSTRSNQEQDRKVGKHYNQKLEYKKTGIQGEKNKIRSKHNKQYKPYKDIIAPDSQLHHEWIPKTAEYRGVALVEAEPHQYGIVDVIEILDGKITLLTEEEVRRVKK